MWRLNGFGFIVVLELSFILRWGSTQHQDQTNSGEKMKIAYGGMLDKKLPTSNNNTDVLKAAQFGLEYALKRLPFALPLDENQQIHQKFKIIAPKKLKLVYTADGYEPFQLKVRLNDGSYGKKSLIWGYTYYFSVLWDVSLSSWQHNFIITHYWDGKFYMFSHTFHKREEVSQDSIEDTEFPSPKLVDSAHLSVIVKHDSLSHNMEFPRCHPENPLLQFAQCHKDERYFLPRNIYSKQSNPKRDRTTSLHGDVFKLKILTYNIWNMNSLSEGKIGYTKRIKRLAQACLYADADIIAFQEVRFQDGRGGKLGPNQVEHLGDLLPQYQFIYQPAQIQTDGLPQRVEEGVAIFSKFPIVSHDYLLLKRNLKDNADGHQRILLHAAIKLPTSDVVHIFNTHLSLSHRARAVSVVEIWQRMQKFDGPAFLMGDFNAEAHNREVEFLAGEEGIDSLWTRGLKDSWKVKYGIKHPGYTYSTLEDELTKRIDLIFFRELPNVSLGDVTLLDDGGREVEAASDHLGLLGTYLIKNYD